jgi:tetratricopeptide (TPR) repeat protein
LPASAGNGRHVKHSTPARGPLEEGQKFGPRYHIIRLLGVGGMGAVYQAWDAELSVAVALKVVRPEVSRDPVAAREIERRFKQELLLARQVTHKNVVRIYDLGEIDGIKYITMSYIQGTDLATTLHDRGRFAVSTVMPLARQIVEGLKAAHEAGVVHRDLKPANIMIEGDRAIVMDFGIARSTSQAGTVPAAPMSTSVPNSAVGDPAWDDAMTQAAATVAGSVVGTVEYMAPEQARGQPVDQRADIYAFGLILYDLLVGRRRAEHSPSAIAELRTRMEQSPPPPKSLVAEIPDALDQLVSRCIDPDPAARFQTTDELGTALGRLDDRGEPLPIHRVFGMRAAVAALGLFMALLVGTWWFSRGPALPVQHDPVSVVIADFVNNTKDAAFDGTLETAMQRALEGAGFISAYDRAGIRRILGVLPPETLDETSALELAVQQGVGVVLSGTVSTENGGYRVSVRAVRAVTGELIVDANDSANNKDQVLASAAQLATEVRQALGDDESESAQRFAMETLSATSLDVVREYAGAMEALSRSEYAEALQGFSRAVERDPKFGLAYAGMAISVFNLYRPQEAERYAKEAISHVDGMTERERYRTRGLYYLVTNDYQPCVKEYGDLIAQYEADAAARNNLALCSTQLRDWPTALDQMKRAVQILPRRALYQGNLAVYLSYASDFPASEEAARSMPEPTLLGQTAIAFAQVGQGQLAEARETYQALGKFDGGASRTASGLGDLAIYEGRFSDAERILAEGASADLKNEAPDRAAAKFVALAHARVLQGRNREAAAAVDAALKASQAVKIQFLAARIFLQAGERARAEKLAADLAMQFLAEPRAYAKIIEGEVALDGGDVRKAITLLTEANTLFDTWMGHFDLGRAYLEAHRFPQADSEFDRCIGRRGEVLALFLDEEPTYGYLPPVYYYQGRVRQGLGTAGFDDSYRQYLAIRGNSAEDRLLPEVRKRAGN